MPITTLKGKIFWQIDLSEATAGDSWVMSADAHIKEIRLTGIGVDDYMVFYENYGSYPEIVKLDYFRPATLFLGKLMTKVGFAWDNCSIASPSTAILSIELD